MRSCKKSETDLRRSAASLALMSMGLFGLGGCQVIKGIFTAGFGIGAIVVLGIVGIVIGAVAMVRRT